MIVIEWPYDSAATIISEDVLNELYIVQHTSLHDSMVIENRQAIENILAILRMFVIVLGVLLGLGTSMCVARAGTRRPPVPIAQPLNAEVLKTASV